MLNRRPRRQMNQMNVVPYIDVMLVLLVIFMVTAPMFTPALLDVPSVSHARAPDHPPVEIVLQDAQHVLLRDGNDERTLSSLTELVAAVTPMAGRDVPFVITASRDMKYADVVGAADALHRAGVRRVALTVSQKQ